MSSELLSVLFLVVTAACLYSDQGSAPSPQAPTGLRCEYLVDPLGIDTPKPRFFWVLEHASRDQKQSAYQILVVSRPDSAQPDVWDSGKVSSEKSIQVEYGGKALESNKSYYWKVRWWDRQETASPYSATAHFDTGLFSPQEWRGEWIGGKNQMRKEFTLQGTVRRGRAFVCGLGYYELRLNGRKLGSNVLDPGWTTYSKRVLYVTYDITRLLRSGANAVAITLGQGWYKDRALKMQLEIEMEDGSRVTVTSDSSWQTTEGPIVSDSIYNGETYDARKETPGWDLSGYSSQGWSPAAKVHGPAGMLSAQLMPPIRVIDTLVPLAVSQPRPSVFVFDMGQNFSGWARLKVRGPRGSAVRLRFAELLYADGMINQENLRGARAEDVYILKGEGEEFYEPRFTYHGFRYVEVTGFPGVPAADALHGRLVRSAVEQTGSFSCSRPLLNRLQHIIVWGQQSNLHSIPTDCCQRDERMGWMGDAQGTAEEAIYNFDMAAFYANFIRNIRDGQDEAGTITDTVPHIWGSRPADPAWGTAYPLLCWYMFQYYADRRILEENYAGLKKYVEYLRSRSEQGILKLSYYGDWVAVEKTPGELVSSFYYYYDTRILAETANLLGRGADARRYAALAEEIKKAFQRHFFDSRTGSYANGTQTANALPLFLDLVPENQRGGVWGNLFDDIVYRHDSHLTTGIIGTKYIMELLSNSGNGDLAYDIACKTSYPSWGYMIENGATTLWELWQLRTGPSMNSHNHPMFGSVGAWLYKYLAGIRLAENSQGFEKILIQPQMVRDLAHAGASLQTLRGPILSSWSRDGRSVTLQATVPVGSEAEIFLPRFNLQHIRICDGGQAVWEKEAFVSGREGVRGVRRTDSGFVLSVGSGRYELRLEGE